MKTGFIGLGNVGGKLAGSLLRNGVDLRVHDLDAALVGDFVARGASAGGAPAAMMRACDVVITCLPSPAASAAVMAEMLPEMGPGKIWMEMSTTDADEILRIGAEVAAAGGVAVECPVSGGCHRADTGNISIFAGGPRSAVEAVMPLLKHLGRRILHTGDLGTASKLKVMTNYLATVHLAALCEAMTTMKASSDAPTAGASSGETESAVRSRPWIVQGWRPASVVIQPAMTATKPLGPIRIAKRCSSGQSYSVPRQRA